MSAKGLAAFSASSTASGPLGADQVVRVLSLGQQGEAQALARADQRQRRLDRAEGGLAPGVVAVEAQDRLLGHRPEQRALVRR